MKLEELSEKAADLTLESVGKTFEMRRLSLEDEIWLKNEYGDRLAVLLSPESLDLELLCRLAFKLIINKRDFTSQEVNIIDEDGNVQKEKIGGYKLLSKMITSDNDKSSLIIATVAAINRSRPDIEESSQDDSKKK